MAALYASGHCVNQDRAQAYKWFAKAHTEDPNNMWIERNLMWFWIYAAHAVLYFAAGLALGRLISGEWLAGLQLGAS